jgi:superoxide dismutase, Cu-Zn family
MKFESTGAALAAVALLAACAGPMTSSGPMATVKLEPTRGNATAGTVTFAQRGDVTTVRAKVEGLRPGQEHGFHIHDKGDCSSGDGMSAAGHFNPTGKPHGPQDSAEHHAGDLPALKADADGRVDTTFELRGVTIGSGAADIIGRGLIVHAMADDYRTQPTGNSGARIACGVITRAV